MEKIADREKPVHFLGVKQSLRTGVVGLGQCGGLFALSFALLGYEAITFNTSDTDLRGLDLPDSCKFYMSRKGGDGVGRDRELGGSIVRANALKAQQVTMRILGDCEHLILCAGLAGGTGGNIAKLAFALSELRKPITVIGALPREGDGSVDKFNAVMALGELVRAPICSLILVDNNKIAPLFPTATLDAAYRGANNFIAGGYDYLNRLSRDDMIIPLQAFDGEDFRKVFTCKGAITYGTSENFELEADENREQVIQRILCEEALWPWGYDFGSAQKAVLLICAPDSFFMEHKGEYWEKWMSTLSGMTKGCGCYFGLFKTPEGVKPRLTVVFAGMSFPESVRKLMDVARLEAQIMRRKMEKDLAKAEMSTVEEFCFFENGGESIKKAGDTDVKNILAVEEAEKLELEEVDLVTMAREGTSPETGVDTMAVKEMEAEKPKDEFEETLKAIKPYKAIWRYLLAGIFMMILVAGFLVFKVGVFEEQMLEPLEATLNLEEGKILTPAGFISLTPQSDMFFLLVDKTRGKLNLYNSSSQLVKSYSNVLGYEEGNVIQGVNPELPEGIYFAVAKLEGKDLPANFFPLAYRLNYPNPLDSVVEYEAGSLILGGYIGTTKEGFESGLNLGLSETDMKEINYFISLNKTPIMIYNLCEMIPQSAKANKSAEIKGFLSKWQNAWNIKDLGIFRKCYAPEFLPDSGERKNWLEEESFQLGESEKITLENLQILDAGTWVLAMFEQNYQDEYGRGWGIRRLYLGKNVEGEWEIKGEEFLKF